MAGYDQYRSAAALTNGAASQNVGPNKGLYVTFIGSTADGAVAAANGNVGCAGLTITTLSNQTLGIPGLTGSNGKLPYILPIQVRAYESHSTDNQIYLLH
tara:strand:- start:386 stop:685 length:300 start_codon:yes stop_codon:yes gene_type:complete